VLAAAAWPGPLTLVGPARDRLPDGVLGRAGDLTTIAVRVPGEPALRRVLSRLGEPLISTSANRKGQAPPVRLDAVEVEALGPDVVFAAEACEGGEPSTIIDVVAQPPRVLRMGAWKPPLS
jgi:L-threonylcarbamoyladenylate synthase